MNPLNQVNIEEESTIYGISSTYHSDMKCENYDIEITGMQKSNGRISISPRNTFFPDDGFKFIESDPDRVIAIAQMILAFAQMAKKENKKAIDTSTNE